MDQNKNETSQPLVVSLKDQIGFGAFSVVIRESDSDKVLKLFRERDTNNQLGDLGNNEPVLRRAAFNSEIAAYELAMGNANLRPLIPAFHGQMVVDRVIDADGSDVSHEFLLDCCYVLDFVTGDAPAKFTSTLADEHPHLRAAANAFEENGIGYWHDGAVFHPSDPSRMKIIDFAMVDEYGDGATRIALAE